MNPYKRNHFLNVARNMNNYIAASSQRYLRRPYYSPMRDRANFLSIYNEPLTTNFGLSGLIAYGLGGIGMLPNMINMGYYFGYFFNTRA
ncbi:unnamed protein product [Rotaria sordida]|uniref:Uncharacterized protein n=1 Tax=Rotaria sordida TaxID=392033 RepID=A0A818KSQ7_9BILA|nr:unnamed protein product [Rotaria sordida]CAF3555881.1 unnamed protein product [Rotaria sordida]